MCRCIDTGASFGYCESTREMDESFPTKILICSLDFLGKILFLPGYGLEGMFFFCILPLCDWDYHLKHLNNICKPE